MNKSLPTLSAKFPTPIGNYKLTALKSSRFFIFSTFVNYLYSDLFLTNPDSVPCKCNNSPFVDRLHKHMVTGDLQSIKSNVLRKLFIEVKPLKCCILEGLDNCSSGLYCKNGVNKFFFLEWTNSV